VDYSQLNELIEEYGLEDVKDYIYGNIKDSIRLGIEDKDDYKTLGNSRAGGYPDVPSGFIWPKTNDGENMTFIAQLNLSEISSSDKENLLPKNGILYFFMGLDEPADDIEHKVIFVETSDNLKLYKIEETVLDEVYDKFEAYKITSRYSLDVPNDAYVNYDEIGDGDEDYFNMREELMCTEDDIGNMFGYSDGQHDDAELKAALKIIANEQYDYSESEKSKIVSYFNGDIKKAEEEIKNIKMLLEINSDDNIGFQWWDAGCIHFFIRKEDLIQRNFDNTYLSLYSS
jgi:uncharacterized protein YwqG